MAGPEIQLSQRLPESNTAQPKLSLDDVLTPEERKNILCSASKFAVGLERRHSNTIGQPLTDGQRDLLGSNCGVIDFDKWVIDEKEAQERNHKGIEALKAKHPEIFNKPKS